MVEKLNTNVTVTLDAGTTTGSVRQQWATTGQFECDGVDPGFFSRCYKLYPKEAIAGKQVASDGIVAYTGRLGVDTRREFIQFSNSNTASTAVPMHELLGVELRFAFDSEGNEIPLNDIGFYKENGSYDLTATRSFYGAVNIWYRAHYAIFLYKPSISVLAGRGVLKQYGNILSFWNKNMITMEVSPPTWADNPVRYELYRVDSTLLLNKYGNWEAPLNWDDLPAGTLAWDGYKDSPVKGGNGAASARSHEIGYYQPGSGQVHYDRAYLNWEQPKIGVPSWNPQYTFTWQQSLDAAKNDDELLSTLKQINFDAITDRVKDTYPNIEGVVDFFKGTAA